MMKSFIVYSMKMFKAALARRYHQDIDAENQRKVFSNDALWKDYERFISEYPVILSTTHSIRKCAKDPYLLDRKSTRLNSSHVSISYAVFCLKKKRKSNDREYIKTGRVI